MGVPTTVATAHGLSMVRFGTFEADLRSGELRRNGSRVKLQEQPFLILLALLDRPGEVVGRDELRQKLWPADTFVDFDHSLNAAIKRLRDALGDSAENPRFVETVARRGYRFIAPVNGIAERTELPNRDVAVVSGQSSLIASQKWIWAAAALIALLGAGVAIGFRLGVHVSRAPQPVTRRLTANSEEARVLGAAISPDGKYLAFSDKNGCYLREINTGETHSIPLPAGFKAHPESWFPDELHLLVSGVAGPSEPNSLWTISIMGGAPRKLANHGQWPVLSPDGSQIVFVESQQSTWLTADGSQAISVMQADGGKVHQVLEIDGGIFSSSFGPPAWSPDGRRIAVVRAKYSSKWNSESQIEILDLASGRIDVALRDPRLLGPIAWTKDGRLIYSADDTVPPTAGDSSLWAIHIDESNHTFADPVRLTSGDGFARSFTLTSNSTRLAFVRETLQPDVYVAILQPGGKELSNPRRLTLDERDDYPLDWTPDNQSVVFMSNRDGPYHIFKQRLDQSEPELLVGGNEQLSVPRLSSDGSYLHYVISPKWSTGVSQVRLMRVAMAGGPPQLIAEADGINNHQCARAPATMCLFSELDQKRERFFSFDPVKGTPRQIPQLTIESVDSATYNWSLSPDGRTLVTSNIDRTNRVQQTSLIKLTSLTDFTSRTFPIPGWGVLNSLDWAADGKSVWAVARNNNTSALLNIEVNGHVRSIFQEDKMMLGWAIPSRDGRHLALWEASGNANVWMLEKF